MSKAKDAKPKHCSVCKNKKPTSEFPRDASQPDGHKTACRGCWNKRQNDKRERVSARHADAEDRENQRVIAEAKDRARRLASDHEALHLEDFEPASDGEYDVGVANDPRPAARKLTSKASREKRQEFSAAMGQFADELTDAAKAQSRGDGPVLDRMSASSGDYIGKLAEQERRFGNRRLARSISLAEAHEALALRRFKQAATEYLSSKIVPAGYALKAGNAKTKRTVCALLSDLHLGSDLHALDEPVPFRAVEEARRLEFVLRQILDYKPQYRAQSRLCLMLNGDMIEGQLGHDLRGGAPLTEQKVIFWKLLGPFIAQCAAAFPGVDVWCQPGNHGRDKVRHPGRATSRKWDGHEWEMYWALSQMGSDLHNVTWHLDFRAVSSINLHGQYLLLTHGDTELKLGHPDTQASKNAATFDRVNSTRIFGHEYAAAAIGHYHTPRYHPRKPKEIWNGALVPPNGYARAEGHIAEPAGQWLWEAVEGFIVGDARFVEVGVAQDHDERLGSIIQPFRFEE
jgi:hypothetical protein